MRDERLIVTKALIPCYNMEEEKRRESDASIEDRVYIYNHIMPRSKALNMLIIQIRIKKE